MINDEATGAVSPQSIRAALEIVKAAGMDIDEHGHLLLLGGNPEEEEAANIPSSDDQIHHVAVMMLYWILTALSLALVALIAALYLGLLTLDRLDLQIKIRASLDAEERKHAKAPPTGNSTQTPAVGDAHDFGRFGLRAFAHLFESHH
jgi:hypothetical protein